MSQNTPTKHDGRAVLFAVAELFVELSVDQTKPSNSRNDFFMMIAP